MAAVSAAVVMSLLKGMERIGLIVRILVVEDERECREGLCETLYRISPDIEVLSADSGESALKILLRTSMDLVFLDIQMPGMDGLALLAQLREMDDRVNIIMLSAYDQFSYAQQAIRLGAMDFIVKPYTEEAIAQVVNRVRGRLEGSADDEMFFLPDLSQWIMSPTSHADMIAQRLKLTTGQRYAGRMYLLRMYPEDGSPSISRQNRIMKLLYRKIKAAVGQDVCVLVLDSEGMYPVVLFSQEGCSLDVAMLEEWFEEVGDLFGVGVCCAEGPMMPDMLSSVRQSYTQCKSMVEYSFYLPVPCVIREGMVRIDTKRQMDEKRLDNLKSLILKGDANGSCDALDELHRQAMEPPFMPVQRLLYSMHMEFINLLSNVSVNMDNGRRLELAERMGAIAQKNWRIEGFFEAYRELTVELAGGVSSVVNSVNRGIIQNCIEYLHENYNKPELTQEMMARRLHFSAGYFGNMFRQVTGETFVVYLNRLRVAKAQELLINSYLKVYEIAEQTGFASVNYFIRVFKQHTQMSPNRYRMLYSTRSDKL